MTTLARWTNAAPTLASSCVLLAVALQLAGCVAIQDEEDDMMLELPMPSPVAAKPTPPRAASEIVIVGMHEEPGSDPSLIKVVGTIVNRSNAVATRLMVRVEARDALGRAMTRVIVPALSESIAADGGTTTFEASLPRSSAIHDYNAEIVGR